MEYTFDKNEIERLSKLAQSNAGKTLIQKLSAAKSDEINDAVASGDAEKLKLLIREFLSTKEAKEIKQKMEASNG